MGGTAAVRQTLVTLCCTALLKAKKKPTKMPSKKKKKKNQKQQYSPCPNKATKSKKYLTIYSINIDLYYSTKKYYL